MSDIADRIRAAQRSVGSAAATLSTLTEFIEDSDIPERAITAYRDAVENVKNAHSALCGDEYTEMK
jgi:hypothetical protein